MESFRHEIGHEAGKTLTVEEVISILEQHPKDMPVFVHWEGVYAYVEPEGFSMELVHKGMKEDEKTCLVIDAGEY